MGREPDGKAGGVTTGGRGRLALAGAAAVLLVVAMRSFDLPRHLTAALGWVEQQGAAGVAAYVLLYVLACVLFVPGSILTLGAGAVYGVAAGVPIVSAAATLGATAAFLVGRYLARDAVARRVAGNARFAAIDEAVAREGWKIVGLTRLSPVFPFNLLNYAFGLTKISLRDFVVASWAGMLPGTLLFVWLGSIAGDLATLGAARGERTPAEWALYGIGFAATAAVTWYITRIAREALAKRV